MNTLLVFLACLSAAYGYVIGDDDADILYEPLWDKEIEMPASCKSKNMEFCFDNTDYPLDIIEELLKDITNLEVAKDDGDVYRYRDENSDELDCLSQSTTDPIYYIVDESGNDRVVIQAKGKFEQKYSATWCQKEGRITNRTQHILKSTVVDYQMSCENKYMNYDFLVLSLKPDGFGMWKMERARTKTGIPVCCSCRY